MGEIKKCVLCFSKKWGEIEERGGEREKKTDKQLKEKRKKQRKLPLQLHLSYLSLSLSLSHTHTHTHTQSSTTWSPSTKPTLQFCCKIHRCWPWSWDEEEEEGLSKATAHHVVALLLSSCAGGGDGGSHGSIGAYCANVVRVRELADGRGEGQPPVIWPHLPRLPPYRPLRWRFQHLWLLR